MFYKCLYAEDTGLPILQFDLSEISRVEICKLKEKFTDVFKSHCSVLRIVGFQINGEGSHNQLRKVTTVVDEIFDIYHTLDSCVLSVQPSQRESIEAQFVNTDSLELKAVYVTKPSPCLYLQDIKDSFSQYGYLMNLTEGNKKVCTSLKDSSSILYNIVACKADTDLEEVLFYNEAALSNFYIVPIFKSLDFRYHITEDSISFCFNQYILNFEEAICEIFNEILDHDEKTTDLA